MRNKPARLTNKQGGDFLPCSEHLLMSKRPPAEDTDQAVDRTLKVSINRGTQAQPSVRNTGGIALPVKAAGATRASSSQISSRGGQASSRHGQQSNRTGTSSRAPKKTSHSRPIREMVGNLSSAPAQPSNRSMPVLPAAKASRLSQRSKASSQQSERMSRRSTNVKASLSSTLQPEPQMDMVNEMEPAVLQDSLNPTLDANARHAAPEVPTAFTAPDAPAIAGTCPLPSVAQVSGSSEPLLLSPAGAKKAQAATCIQKLQRGKSSRKMQRAKGTSDVGVKASSEIEGGNSSRRFHATLKDSLPSSARGTPRASLLSHSASYAADATSKQTEAATTIARFARGSSGRLIIARRREKLKPAVPIVPRTADVGTLSMPGNVTAQQVNAATKIEALFRGRSGRLMLKSAAARSELDVEQRQQRAATLIGRIARGHSGRLKLAPQRQKLRPAVPFAPRASSPLPTSVVSAEEQARRKAAATKIEALLRGNSGRIKLSNSGRMKLKAATTSIERQHHAATLIEKIARGRSGRLKMGGSGRLKMGASGQMKSSPVSAAAAKAATASGARSIIADRADATAVAILPMSTTKVDAQLRSSKELRESAAELLLRAEERRARVGVLQSDTSIGVILGRAIVERGITVAQLIADWDKNKDQQISKVEFKQGVRNNLGIAARNAEIDALFAEMDADGGGTLDLSELRIAIRGMHEAYRRAVAEEEACLKRASTCERMADRMASVIKATERAESKAETLQRYTTHPPLMARIGRTVRAHLAKVKGSTVADVVRKWVGAGGQPLELSADVDVGAESGSSSGFEGAQAPSLLRRSAFLKQMRMLKNIGEVRMEGSSTEADGQFDALFDEIARTLGQELDEAASGLERDDHAVSALATIEALLAAAEELESQMSRLTDETARLQCEALVLQEQFEQDSRVELAAASEAEAAATEAEEAARAAKNEEEARREARAKRRAAREAKELAERETRIAARRAGTALGQAFTPTATPKGTPRVAGTPSNLSTPKSTPKGTPKGTPRNSAGDQAAFKRMEGGRMGYGTETKAYVKSSPGPTTSSGTSDQVKHKAATKISALVRGKSSRLHIVDASHHDRTITFGGKAPPSLAVE